MTSDQPIWQKRPKYQTRTEFVFLSVDVIGHSKLFRGHLSNRQMSENNERLTKLREFVHACIPQFEKRKDLQWDWASDGGIFGFPSSEFDIVTTERAVNCAIQIWEKLPDTVDGEIALHISLDRGDAFFVREPGMRRSDALNTAAKLKSPTGQTAILVTQRICDDLRPDLVDRFREQEPLQDGTRIYAYLPALQRGMFDLAEKHAGKEEWVITAHCYYRHGRYLLASGLLSEAKDAFNQALRAINKVPKRQRHRYFHRTLRVLYKTWRSLTRWNPRCDYPAPRKFFAGDEVEQLRKLRPGPLRANLILHLELISEQLDLLCAKMLNMAAGLSTLEAALLLQRAGYSPHHYGNALATRVDRVKDDLAKNHHRSIDGDCSMCSGAALSALSLGGRSYENEAGQIREWLRLLGPDRYCILGRDYTDAKTNEHALQYAANVLQGFLDTIAARQSPVDEEIDRDIEAVAKVFFVPSQPDPRGFFKEWMRHRNIDAFEVCTYVLPPFIRYLISGRKLEPEQQQHLCEALNVLAKNLLADASNPERPGRLYAARENIGGLALGLFVGMDKNVETVARHVLELFALRAKSEFAERGSTMLDSNLDRTRRFLEGWLLQWEAVLFTLDKMPDPRPYVRDLLMTYSPPENAE